MFTLVVYTMRRNGIDHKFADVYVTSISKNWLNDMWKDKSIHSINTTKYETLVDAQAMQNRVRKAFKI